MRPSFVLTVAVFAGLACGNASSKTPPAAESTRVPVTIQTAAGPVTFQAELAITPQERERGLMFREELGPREGMLFVFPQEQQLSFWMKNTLIPLDIIFIRADRTILGVVREAEPQTLSPRRVAGVSQYVLEIAGGLAETLGIEAGQRATFMAPEAPR